MTVILGDLTAPKPAIGTGLSIAPGSNSSDLLPAKADVASASYNFDKNTATLNMLSTTRFPSISRTASDRTCPK